MAKNISFNAIRPFDLPELPPDLTIGNEQFTNLLLEARTELAELKGYSIALPNPMLLLSPAILKEAVDSSEIENINTTIERVLQQQLFPETEQKTENKEVIRYKDAILYGYKNLEKLSLSNRLIRDIHKNLLTERSHGYRKLQNHIENSVTQKIIYTPPPPNEINRLMTNWEHYVHNSDKAIDPLIRCAISHYQFEAIHPFNDGNGRVGRMLMVLYLVYKEVLHYPILFISGYITKNRSEYYKLLQGVNENKEWRPFIEYMLKAFCIQAQQTKEQLIKLMLMYYETKDKIKETCSEVYSSDLVELIFATPIITPVRLAGQMGIHYTTATRYLKKLTDMGFLDNKKVGKYQLYVNKKLLLMLNGEHEEDTTVKLTTSVHSQRG
jgi:Fic family protein